MSDPGKLLFTLVHPNLAVLSDKKREWLLDNLGIETTDEPACLGRLMTREELAMLGSVRFRGRITP